MPPPPIKITPVVVVVMVLGQIAFKILHPDNGAIFFCCVFYIGSVWLLLYVCVVHLFGILKAALLSEVYSLTFLTTTKDKVRHDEKVQSSLAIFKFAQFGDVRKTVIKHKHSQPKCCKLLR